MSATESLILNEISNTLKKMVGDVDIIDNDAIKMQIIPMSFEDWHTADEGSIIIPHSLGEMPDTVLVLNSNLSFNGADYYDGYFADHRLIGKIDRTFRSFNDVYDYPYVVYYDANSIRTEDHQYSSEILAGDSADALLTWDDKVVTIKPYDNIVFMPKTDAAYGDLGAYNVIAIKRKAVV